MAVEARKGRAALWLPEWLGEVVLAQPCADKGARDAMPIRPSRHASKTPTALQGPTHRRCQRCVPGALQQPKSTAGARSAAAQLRATAEAIQPAAKSPGLLLVRSS